MVPIRPYIKSKLKHSLSHLNKYDRKSKADYPMFKGYLRTKL